MFGKGLVRLLIFFWYTGARGVLRNTKEVYVRLKIEVSLMNDVDDLSEGLFLLNELIHALERVHGIHLFPDIEQEIFSLWPVNLIDPDRVKVLEHQEITKVWLFLRFTGLVYAIAKHRLLESLLHYIVSRDLSEEDAQVSLLLNVVLEVYKVGLVEAGSHPDLSQQIVKLVFMCLADQFVLPKCKLLNFITNLNV